MQSRATMALDASQFTVFIYTIRHLKFGGLNKVRCYIAGIFFPTAHALIGYSVLGHMTSYDETVSHKNLSAGNIAKSMTSEGNSALLPANVDRRPPLQSEV